MNMIDRPAVDDLVELDNVTNVTIVTYMSIIAMSKFNEVTEYPTIENFTTYKLSKHMIDKMYYMGKSAIRLAVDRLIEVGFIEYNEEDKTLIVLNSGIAHNPSEDLGYKSMGYITLHHFFFEKVFFDLTLSAKKLALIVCSRLNGEPTKSIKINFKSIKNPETFPKWKKTFKVTRLAHIKSIVEELKGLFTISILKHNTVAFRLNTLSRALVTGTDKFFKFTQKQQEQTEKIFEEENKNGFSFSLNDIKAVCEATCNYTMEVRRRTIKELCKNSRKNVKNIFGYAKKLIARISRGLSYKDYIDIYTA